jgi:prolyl 4-hydroxylase
MMSAGMAGGWVSKAIGLSAGSALIALFVPYLRDPSLLAPLAQKLPMLAPLVGVGEAVPGAFTCLHQNYTTEIVSLDPLVMYIHNFINPQDIAALLAAGEGEFQPSVVKKGGRMVDTPDRTSWSAALSRDEPVVECILERSRKFMGTMMAPGKDDMGPPQLVRYTAGQRFNIHHDWFERFQPSRDDDRDRYFNRLASFFVILQDNCTEGETHFPYIKPIAPQNFADKETAVWREHERGGLAFRPIAGNALFWVNLYKNGTGDRRVMHAGLPLKDGLKTAMNIWPRQYIGADAWEQEQQEQQPPQPET